MRSIIITLIIIASSMSGAIAQCGDDLLPDAQSKLGDYVYVKDVRVSLKKSRRNKEPQKVQQKMMLSKNIEYKFVVKNEDNDGKVIVTLYSHMGGKIMSNYNPKTKRYINEFSFKCRSAAPVKIEAMFEDGSGGCSVCVIGTKKF